MIAVVKKKRKTSFSTASEKNGEPQWKKKKIAVPFFINERFLLYESRSKKKRQSKVSLHHSPFKKKKRGPLSTSANQEKKTRIHFVSNVMGPRERKKKHAWSGSLLRERWPQQLTT